MNTDSQAQIISCPGEIDDELQLIPFVALEAEMVMQNLPEQSEIDIVSPTRTTMISHPFPEHKTALNVLHISCHGQQQVNGLTRLLLSSREISAYDLWGIAPEHTINLAMINACTGGIVLDNEEGDPQGLIVPLLARANKVITSLLPVNDIVATVFSALFYHFMHTDLSVELSFLKAKQQIVSGDIPADILEKMIVVMEPIFAQANLYSNISRLQAQLLEPTAETYLLHCLAAIVPDVREAVKISSLKEISLGEYLKTEFRERIRLTNIPRVAREIAMAGYQLYG